MLGILAGSIASKLYPDLDMGLVMQFALVHDLVEVHAGDTDTIVNTSVESMKQKSEREEQALEKIKLSFGKDFGWIHNTIEKYESLDTKEARFVKMLDKILPKLTVILSNAASFNNRGISKSQFQSVVDSQKDKFQKLAYDMPELFELWEYFANKAAELIKD